MSVAFKTAAALVLLVGLTAAPFAASAADPADTTGRYSMSPADGGFVRLDRQTGAMTLCAKPDPSKPDAGWNCTPMGDAQQTTNSEIERLEAENKSLKADKRHMEEMLGMADPSKPQTPETGTLPPPAMKIPSEQDVDKVFDYFEGMMKKFRERMKKLEDDPGTERQL